MDFNAKCILFDIKTKNCSEVNITSVKDIFNVFGNAEDIKVSQVNIDKYNKVYYDASNLADGITGWCSTFAEHNEMTGEWVDCQGKDYLIGSKLLLVLCDDNKPIDITEKCKEYIISCLKL